MNYKNVTIVLVAVPSLEHYEHGAGHTHAYLK